MTTTEPLDPPDRAPRAWKPVTVRFRAETLQEIRRLAEQQDCGQAFLIRQAVEQYLRRSR